MTGQSLLRLFVAVELPHEVRQVMARFLEVLQRVRHPSLRWVASESIHLTLKFLGDVAPERVSGLCDVTQEALRGHAPFDLRLAEGGVFPTPQAPRVAWVGLRGDVAAASVLQRDVEGALVALGFPREGRAFQPHLTVGRVRGPLPGLARARLLDALQSGSGAGGPAFRVEAVSLMRSTLRSEGAVYERLSLLPLSAPLSGIVG